MDAVFFSAKRVHLTLSRAGRRFLKPFGLTPARFEMLYVIEHLGINMQNELCAALGLARATVSEMLHVLEELGLLERWWARRTKCMMLTPRGERAFDAAYAGCIGNGNVTVAVDAAITRGDAAVDPDVKRDELFKAEKALRWFFGDASTRYDLYAFDWYENLGCFAWPNQDRDWPERELPWADELTQLEPASQ